MKISVLIHNLNRALPLERCLASVAKQVYRPLEVVILEAGSTDNSAGVIERRCQELLNAGIETKVVRCPLMGVAASRNLAARHASGDLLCFLDNDAAFASSDGLCQAEHTFIQNPRLAVISFQVLQADSNKIDLSAWTFRRSLANWSRETFKTFIFTGGACCIRTNAFWEAGGFWDHLRYGREEEDMGLALVDKGWELLYWPAIAIRHYPESRGRMSLAERRFVELRNGLLVSWRRLPIPVAILAIAGRICTMSLAALREKNSVRLLIGAVPKAAAEWRLSHLRRSPVTFKSSWRYAALHLPNKD
ncbi:MAG: glycosyltransferase family 2 protein [Formivibrio sp.]|nr:glycosyltransferase family 2 protein [Formivibrio sp.]